MHLSYLNEIFAEFHEFLFAMRVGRGKRNHAFHAYSVFQAPNTEAFDKKHLIVIISFKKNCD